MILFETQNSVYQVKVKDGQFAVTKIRELHPSPFNEVYQTRIANYCYIEVGEPAGFGAWHTSRFTRLLDTWPEPSRVNVEDREDDTRL